MKIELVDVKRQYHFLKDEIDGAIKKVLNEGNYILGEEVAIFENNFARYCGVDCAIGVDSGTSALQLILLSLNIGEGDEIIIPANTFNATAAAIRYVNAKPVLVDANQRTFNINVDEIENKITKKTKAIMVVHLYGQPVDMERIQNIAKKNNLLIIEDACQAHGAEFNGQRVGTFGTAAAFSLYPRKNLGAAGDGGIAVTNDNKLITKMKILREYGEKGKHEILGYNKRLDTLQAAILNVKLKYLDLWNEDRIRIAKKYTEEFKELPIITPLTDPRTKHVFHLYVIQVENGDVRDALRKYLSQYEIQTDIHYPKPIHLQGAFKDLGYKKGDFPVSEKLSENIISLPLYPMMTDEELDIVITKVKEFFK
ncbi:DegT/DnrJ/EryC1/StrS family aminotransferase [Candidatus Woesearchaeota archaeon]|nr:DegT/DnrJ/EryC1/StrS family aminotransferase [Candidatus Woesearchaeota archaeon]